MLINRLLESENAHRTRVAPSDRHDNYSVFECTCGQRFEPDSIGRTPYEAPPLPLVHCSVKKLQALGLPVGHEPEPGELESARPGTVIFIDGVLMKLSRPYSDKPWFAQDGTTHATAEVADRALVIWSPDA